MTSAVFKDAATLLQDLPCGPKKYFEHLPSTYYLVLN